MNQGYSTWAGERKPHPVHLPRQKELRHCSTCQGQRACILLGCLPQVCQPLTVMHNNVRHLSLIICHRHSFWVSSRLRHVRVMLFVDRASGKTRTLPFNSPFQSPCACCRRAAGAHCGCCKACWAIPLRSEEKSLSAASQAIS